MTDVPPALHWWFVGTSLSPPSRVLFSRSRLGVPQAGGATFRLALRLGFFTLSFIPPLPALSESYLIFPYRSDKQCRGDKYKKVELLSKEERAHRRILMIQCNVGSSRFRKDSLSDSLQDSESAKAIPVLPGSLWRARHVSWERVQVRLAEFFPLLGLKPVEKAKDMVGKAIHLMTL